MKTVFNTCSLLSIVLVIFLYSTNIFWADLSYSKTRIRRFSQEIKKRKWSNPNAAQHNERFISNNLSAFFAKNIENIPEETFLNNFSSIFVVNKSIIGFQWPVFSSFSASRLCRYSGHGPFLLAAVPSVASHTEQRKAIRETWGSVAYGRAWSGGQVYPTGSVKIVFVFGRSKTREDDMVLREESAYYGDIVQADFEDSYGNLSLKTLTILRWMTMYCPLAKHLLKVDEDTFVNVPLLLQLLGAVSSLNTRYILGFIYTSQPSRVRHGGKWAVPPPLYPPQYYPYYTVGHSYVVSGDCVKDLTSACRHFRLLAIEDAFFTGIVAKAVNITRLHCRLFASRHRKVSECSVINGGYVAETLCNAEKLRRLWMLMQGNACSSTRSGEEEYKDVAASVESSRLTSPIP